MKKLLILVAVMIWLPKAHAACTVTVTPANTTLQIKQNEPISASLPGCTGSTTTWNLTCLPSGSNCGALTNKTRVSATYNAPMAAPPGTVNVKITATNTGVTCSGSNCAAVTIKVPTGLTVTPANSSIYLGNTQTMSAAENFSDGSSQSGVAASFSSSNTTVATVSGSTVTSVNFSAIPGPVTLTATYTDLQTLAPVTGNTTLAVTTAAQINAVFPPLIPRASLATTDTCNLFYPTSSPNWNAFMTLIQGGATSDGEYIWAINPYITWNQIETSQNNYDFTCFDLYIQNFVNAGKKVNFIVRGITDGNTGNVTNPSTPAYVLSNGEDVVNDTNKCVFQNFPAVYESGYEAPLKNFVTAVLKHYSNSCSTASPAVPPCSGNSGANGPALAPAVGYIRFGLSSGGEAFPHCIAWMRTLSAPNTYVSEVSPFNPANPKTWLTYVSGMDSYEQSQGSSIQLMGALNEAETPTNYAYPDGEAYYAVQYGQGFGSQGLQESDITATTCTSDWCGMFDTYHTQAPLLELQTVAVSDPTNTLPAGSLNDTVPWAIANHHANVFEIYTTDLFLAFDPTDYTSSLSGYNSGYTSYSSSYDTTLKNAASGH